MNFNKSSSYFHTLDSRESKEDEAQHDEEATDPFEFHSKKRPKRKPIVLLKDNDSKFRDKDLFSKSFDVKTLKDDKIFGQTNAEMDQLRIIDEEDIGYKITEIKNATHHKSKTHQQDILVTTSAKDLPHLSKFWKFKNSVSKNAVQPKPKV